MKISQNDRSRLRELAKLQLEYASTPENRVREQRWYAHNDFKSSTPIVTIEEMSFYQDVARPQLCETPEARQMEWQLLSQIIGREDVDDDRVTADFFGINLYSWFKPFGLDAKADNKGNDLAYIYTPHISDLEADFHKLGKSTWGIYPESTQEFAEIAADVLGDILPVRVGSGSPYACPTQWLIQMMHMETLMYALCDYPELVHQAMDMVTADYVEYQRELEAGGLLTPNNGNNGVAQGTYAFTNELCQAQQTSGIKLSDLWGYVDSQETAAISRDMFAEFFFPYYKRITDLWGFVNYGCCEAVHEIWDNCLSQMQNLRKISISPWCNEEFMGDKLRGTKVIYHRKPSPNFMGVDKVFDEKAFSKHITDTLRAARGCKLEFSFRDIYTLQGEKWRAKRAYEIVKGLIEEYWV